MQSLVSLLGFRQTSNLVHGKVIGQDSEVRHTREHKHMQIPLQRGDDLNIFSVKVARTITPKNAIKEEIKNTLGHLPADALVLCKVLLRGEERAQPRPIEALLGRTFLFRRSLNGSASFLFSTFRFSVPLLYSL